MTELRDRIAASLAEADGMDWDAWSASSQDGYLLRADAVIRELGLRVEYGWLDHEDSGTLYDSLDEARESTHGSGESLRSRLVSDWGDVPEEGPATNGGERQ